MQKNYDNELLNPISYYNSSLKNVHNENVIKMFDDLVKKSGVNVEENRNTIKEIKNLNNKLDIINNALTKNKSIKTFLIIIDVLIWLSALFTLYLYINDGSLPIYVSISLFALAIFLTVYFIYIIKKKINKLIETKTKEKEELVKKIDELTSLSWRQMSKLNSSYDDYISLELCNQTTPLIKLDHHFTPARFCKLKDQYGFKENDSKFSSTVFVQSGTILGNPFVILKDHVQEWINKTYTGSIVIHWTTTSRDSNGNLHTNHHTQTLTASVVKPFPNYYYTTKLVYANDAAPNLSFSRMPTELSTIEDEKKLERKINKAAKKLDKKAEKDLTDDDPTTNYQRFADNDFEVLFGGTDRDNELEFRLLFTPLAQKNEIELIKSKEPYGDDFQFVKRKCLNYIQTMHSQNFDYSASPSHYISNDIDEAKSKFVTYNNTYFKSLYFDFAPLLCIPLYQQHKAREYIYNNSYPANMTSYEHETIANRFNAKLFKHKDSDTNAILKTSFTGKTKETDEVSVKAYTYKAEKRVDFINKLGGDGCVHTIPVEYYVYLPLENERNITVKSNKITKPNFTSKVGTNSFESFVNKFNKGNEYVFSRGVFSMLTDKDYTDNDDEIFDNIFTSDNREEADDKSILEKVIDKTEKL